MSNITLNTPYSGMIILGKRGSGKTTFLNQITGEHPDLFLIWTTDIIITLTQ